VPLLLGAATLQTPKGPVEVRESEFDGAFWVCSAEVAKALGGTFGEDKTYKRPFLQVPGHRILLSEETAVFSFDGKVLRLSRSPVKKDGCLWLPVDFLGAFGKYASQEAAPSPKAPSADGRPVVELGLDGEGTRLTFQGTGVFEARVKEEGRTIEILLPSGTFGPLPRLSPGSAFEKGELLESGKVLRLTWRPGSSGEVLRLKNPDRLVVVARKDGPGVQPPPSPQPPANVPLTPLTPGGTSPAAQTPPSLANGPGIDFVVLDPGHGGSEVGAEGPDGTLEKDLTLAICLKTKAALERVGFKVTLTRTADIVVPLQTRTVFANIQQADLFLCIHVNSSPSSKAHGTETYYHSTEATDLWAKGLADRENAVPQQTPGDREGVSLVLWDLAQAGHIRMSSALAESVQRQFNDLLSTKDRGVRQAPFAVLQGAQMPAVLVEVAFLSNPSEAKKLADVGFQEQVAQSLAQAVKAFKAANEAPPQAAPSGAGVP
jgi:N-acetylmuramoyl-L-alanine amidase